ncbi:MAG: hypothetical protein BJ554DRAFT_3432 [Olpidium bornovanus]|uniref:Uncharacterized protein n=1 Tax=Olpidium bornovanus TaxID=278681 RepID=A0A8H8DLL7_9FUNG|nr:MAG: hypothetical protein BJ554DRAFT_3432 [Olpidium bornovanus]
MGGTNSVGHVVTAVNEVLRDHVPKVTIPFIDDLPMRGPRVEECNHTVDKATEARKFVVNHVNAVEGVHSSLERAGLTLSGVKSSFGMSEVLVVGF